MPPCQPLPSSRVPSKPRNQKRCLRPKAAKPAEPPHKKTIDDFVILEEMGQGLPIVR